MGHALRMPSLPKGARQDFVEELFRLYRKAGRPSLREISDAVEQTSGKTSVSRETIRRMLLGIAVPQRWVTAEAVFAALCALSDTDPSSERWEGSINDEPVSHRAAFMDVWNAAIDDLPAPSRSPAYTSDPWAPAGGNGGFSDDPPF